MPLPRVHFTHFAEIYIYNTFGQISYRILRKFLKINPNISFYQAFKKWMESNRTVTIKHRIAISIYHFLSVCFNNFSENPSIKIFESPTKDGWDEAICRLIFHTPARSYIFRHSVSCDLTAR